MKGKTALITGASSGIGAAIALKYASLGADIAIVYRNSAEGAEQTRQKCAELGVKAEIYQCDVADFGAAKETVAAIRKEFGGIDILVNNAGMTRDGLLAVMKEEDFDDVISTNLKGAFNMTRMCVPLFLRKRGGKIVNISSVVGITGNPGQANYSASKAGIIGLTKSTALELASRNITCNAIAPGYISTRMTAALAGENPEGDDKMLSAIPLGRAGKPEDVAEAAAFLASSAADYITGVVLKVDGGLAI